MLSLRCRSTLRWLMIGAPFLLAGCATMKVQQIPGPVPAIDFLGSNDFIIIQPYDWRIGSTDKVIAVPLGFVPDYASIPPGVRWILPKQSVYSRAAVIHDYLYWSQICTKDQADNLLLIAMKELNVTRWKRKAIYDAVHVAGGGAWSQNAKERQAGKPKVVPADHYGLATTMNWPQARQRLIREGIHDPVLPQNPDACALGNGKIVP